MLLVVVVVQLIWLQASVVASLLCLRSSPPASARWLGEAALIVLCKLASVYCVGIDLVPRLCWPGRLGRRLFFSLEVGVRHACMLSAMLKLYESFVSVLGVVLSSALKAGSTFPPLATSTALTTLVSMPGKASMSVFSACWCGLIGRGGFGGGISVASSEKRTPGLGDLEVGGGETRLS